MTLKAANQVLVLFGATGDLSRRMLLPSLFGLDGDGLLPERMRIVATARSSLETDAFRALAAEAITTGVDAGRRSGASVSRFLDRLRYVPLDAGDVEGYGALAEAVGDGRDGLSIFLSTAPSLFEPTIAGLSASGLAGGSTRLALEKPLGHDLASSAAINDAVGAAFPESRTFRIDHYLGKETVQNLLALRFGNMLFEPLWSASGIDHVQITVAETVGLEGRGAYFDDVGALRDMVQNHMLQLLALVAMEPPARFDATAVRDEKVKVLRSLRPMDRTTVASHSVTGQYTAGAVAGSLAPAYAEELGKPSGAETFVALKAHIDNWRWKGVPFYLRTGKRLPTRLSEIVVRFKAVPHSIFEGSRLAPNTLIIRLQPEENIRLEVMAKQPGLDRDGLRLRVVPLDIGLANAFAEYRRRIAYERLLLDLLEGRPTLFVRRDEIEAQWTWIDAIREGWAATGQTPRPYGAGTWGPAAAIGLAERDGVSWHE
jgi:glucose-6-phosphate 1-dehydrogenase